MLGLQLRTKKKSRQPTSPRSKSQVASDSRSANVSAEGGSGLSGNALSADGGESVRLEEVSSSLGSSRDEVVARRGAVRDVARESSCSLGGGEDSEGEEAGDEAGGVHV